MTVWQLFRILKAILIYFFSIISQNPPFVGPICRMRCSFTSASRRRWTLLFVIEILRLISSMEISGFPWIISIIAFFWRAILPVCIGFVSVCIGFVSVCIGFWPFFFELLYRSVSAVPPMLIASNFSRRIWTVTPPCSTFNGKCGRSQLLGFEAVDYLFDTSAPRFNEAGAVEGFGHFWVAGFGGMFAHKFLNR